MTKQIRNKVVTVIAVLLMAVAAFLTVLLFVIDDEPDKKSDTKTSATYAAEEHETSDSPSTTFAPAKYLWEYGPDDSKFEKPSKLK